MKTLITKTALALVASGLAVTALPAAALDFNTAGYSAAPVEDTWERNRDRYRDRYYDRRGNDRRYYNNRSNYGEPVYRDTRVWRGNDGRTYCRKKNGTTGLIIGGAAGALLGREIDGGRDRTLGTVLGAAAGALIGKEVDGGTRCR
ncbi:MAG TPA: glycine zipper 2TM domain-containing protein [Croceibacterium sp.]|nr:glycine zipper 2TM domain-containing protein [Croceibacterium sp.]